MDAEVFRLPVTFAQRWMWLLDQFDTEGPARVVPWRAPVTGPLDVAALRSALATVVDRHEPLRTRVATVDGEPVALVASAPRLAAPLPADDDGSLSVEDVHGDIEARVAELIARPIDPAAGPALRVTVLREGPDRHELVVVSHHIVVDGLSCGLFFAELAAAYDAHVRGIPVDLPELPIAYGDFALWQAERWADGGYRDDGAYWRAALNGAPTVLGLPTDRPRGPWSAHPGATVTFTLDEPVAGGLRAGARAAGATVFMTLLALYGTVLSRYGGTEDLLIGTPVAGRVRRETEGLIGTFANTLPIRVTTGGDPTFADLLARVRDATAGALAHQEMPFDRIVEIASPERSVTHAPLVQVRFALDEPPAPVTGGGVTFEPRVVEMGVAEADLALAVRDTGTRLDGRLTYDPRLFDAATVEAFAGALVATATAVANDPRVRVGEVDLLGDQTRAWLAAHGTGPALSGATDLVNLISGGEQGDVVAGDTVLTREQVVEWAGRIAAGLRAAGAGPEATVGLCLPRGAALIPTMLGVWWAGAAYVPLDPAYPTERLRAMVEDSGVTVVATQSSLAGLVRGLVGPTVPVIRVDSAELRSVPPIAPVAVAPEALAYTIFTSGSTGRPKGVAVPRGAVAALLCAFRDGIDLRAGEVLVAVTTLSFDIAVLELLLPLVCCARVVIADAAVAADGVALRQLLETAHADALQATPATWRALATAGGVPATLRLRLCGGEAVPPDLADLLTADGAEAWNVYGPTETTVWSAAGRILPRPAPIEVGPPIAGTHIYVLDAALRPVPPGVVGEVYLGGAGLARGYHGRPGFTAERFLPDPMAATPGARMYRTGDLARWRPSGRLEMLGRADHQVKLRGFRIETGEVEAVLARHPSVAHSIVAPYTPPGATEPAALVGYVVPADAPIDVATLRRHLQAQLPDYMVPTAFVSLNSLPLTANGKLDRARLPEPTWGDATTTYAPPRTALQQSLLEMWTELLPGGSAAGGAAPAAGGAAPAAPAARRIGIHDNFFALGGHSLIAIQLATRLQATHGVRVPLRMLFANPTIAGLAAAVEELTTGDAIAVEPARDAIAQAERDLAEIDLDDLLGSMGR